MAENKKLLTLDQIKMAVERAKADSASRVSELAALVAQGLEDAEHSGITVTLPAASWSDRELTIAHDSFLADSNYWYFVCGDADNFSAWSDAVIYAENIKENGYMTFHCMVTPEVDLTVLILRLEVEIINE